MSLCWHLPFTWWHKDALWHICDTTGLVQETCTGPNAILDCAMRAQFNPDFTIDAAMPRVCAASYGGRAVVEASPSQG